MTEEHRRMALIKPQRPGDRLTLELDTRPVIIIRLIGVIVDAGVLNWVQEDQWPPKGT